MTPSPEPHPTPVAPWWQRLHPHIVFLVLGTVFGLAVMAANPPFQAPDEFEHYFRAVQISEGNVLGQRRGNHSGGELPVPAVAVASTEGIAFFYDKKMTRAIFRNKLQPPFLDWSEAPRGYFHFPHTVIYPPVSYVPQTFAVLLGKLIHLGPLFLLYAVRLSSFVFYLILGWATLRRLPCFRWSCLLLLLAPMSLYLMGSAAPDAVLIGSGFLLTALAVEAAIRPHVALTRRFLALCLALAALLAAAKIVYLPLSLGAAALLLPRFSTWKDRAFFAALTIVVCLLPALLWAQLMTDVYVPGRADIPIDPAAQMRHVLAHPLQYLGVVTHSLREQARFIYEWFVGTLGWGDTPMPQWYYNIFGWGLLACAIAESGGGRLIRWWHRGVMLLAAAGVLMAIVGAQYVTWNAPGSTASIDGICGRYFLPMAPFAVISFPALGRLRVPESIAAWLGTTLAALGSVVCLVVVVLRYYVA